MEDRKNSTPEILSAKDLQEMGFSRSMSYALWTIVNKVDKQNDKIYRKFISA